MYSQAKLPASARIAPSTADRAELARHAEEARRNEAAADHGAAPEEAR